MFYLFWLVLNIVVPYEVAQYPFNETANGIIILLEDFKFSYENHTIWYYSKVDNFHNTVYMYDRDEFLESFQYSKIQNFNQSYMYNLSICVDQLNASYKCQDGFESVSCFSQKKFFNNLNEIMPKNFVNSSLCIRTNYLPLNESQENLYDLFGNSLSNELLLTCNSECRPALDVNYLISFLSC